MRVDVKICTDTDRERENRKMGDVPVAKCAGTAPLPEKTDHPSARDAFLFVVWYFFSLQKGGKETVSEEIEWFY